MRLHRLSLDCFRGFPFPETLRFEGKNVLLYGENGSGKSTLFHALREILPRTRIRRDIGLLANTFIEPPGTPPPSRATVELEFRLASAPDDLAQGRTMRWDHTTTARCTEWEFQAARRLMALDYRSVLETHFVQRTAKELNIYPLLATTILGSAENQTVTGNARPTFREQWQKIIETSGRRWRRGAVTLGWLYRQIRSLHDGLKGIEPVLLPLTNEYLTRLSTGLTIGVELKDAPFYDADTRQKRLTSTGTALLTAEFFGRKVAQPAPFFNEARLSAMALALYLAGVRLSVPDKNLETLPYPRVLVLDDVLIGLDLAHRLPLLELLEDKFPDWQVLLFTHDRAWFEMAQLVTSDNKQWMSLQLHADRTQHGAYVFEQPRQTPPIQDLEDYYLHLAEWHLSSQHDPRTAAFHTRVAFEAKLKTYCHNQHISVPYYLDGAHLTTKDYLDAIEERLDREGTFKLSAFALRRVKMFRARVLNPLAHWSPVVIDASEVRRAIAVVREMKFADEQTRFAVRTRDALAPASLTPVELLDAAAWLRTVFEVDLRNFLIKYGGQVGYRCDWQKLTDTELWDAAKVRMQAVNAVEAPLLIAAVETHGFAFLDAWDYERVSQLTKAQLDAAWAALRAPGQAPKTRLAVFA